MNTTHVYVDDLIIIGNSRFSNHLSDLDKVMLLLNKIGLKLSLKKSFWFQDSVNYLGFTLTREGLKPTMEKVQSILRIKDPMNVKKVLHFVGLVNFYSRFLHMHAKTLSPINDLTRKFKIFDWNKDCESRIHSISTPMKVKPS